LVHGAFAGPDCWDQEVAALRALGYPVVVVPDPLRGLAADADSVRSAVRGIEGPIVLVGHSYGGAVISNAARGLPNVKALVYIAAFLPALGESVMTAVDPGRFPGSLLGPSTIEVHPRADRYRADVFIKPADYQQVFAADVPASVAEWMAQHQHPLAVGAQTEPSGPPAWATIPSWDLITLDDKAIPPAGQRYMAERAHAKIESVHSSHAVMVSHPPAVIRVILDAATGD
jgi:pimeloyl-ACP methyl ester carboxylesterase